MTSWHRILSSTELEENFAIVAKITNLSYACKQQAHYETRSTEELTDMMLKAWDTGDVRRYQLARSYLILKRMRH